MNTIRFRFDDLCAFFTRYQSRLMVGMIPTEGEAPEHVHQPKITIRQDGMVKREYRGFEEISGDISLDVFPRGEPLTRHAPRSARDPRKPFDLLVDIENDLYPKEKLRVNSKLCRARLHFKNGELYTTRHMTDVKFADLKTGQLCAHAPSDIAIDAGLDIEIPKGGYAVLRFRNETEDFVFKGGRDYEVEIANRADSITAEHFRYFYKIMVPKPKRIWAPVSREVAGQPVPGTNPRNPCDPAAFGQADYEIPVENPEPGIWQILWYLLSGLAPRE